jgi:hypothetical protein
MYAAFLGICGAPGYQTGLERFTLPSQTDFLRKYRVLTQPWKKPPGEKAGRLFLSPLTFCPDAGYKQTEGDLKSVGKIRG